MSSQTPYVQQQHKECGGSVVVVARGTDTAFACTRCAVVWLLTGWGTQQLHPSDEWEDSPRATLLQIAGTSPETVTGNGRGVHE